MAQETIRRWAANADQLLEQSTSLHAAIAALAFQLWQDRGTPSSDLPQGLDNFTP